MAAHTFEQDATWTFSSCYYQADNTNTASTSCAPILQPRPVRAVPGVPAWGGDQRGDLARHDEIIYNDTLAYEADWFPGENSLGLTSSDAKYADAGLPKEPPRYETSPPARRRQIQDYDVEGGWTVDASGRTCYVPHGEIKEVDEDNDDPLAIPDDSRTFIAEQLPADATPPPRPVPRSIDLLPPSILERLPLGDGSNVRLPLGDHRSPPPLSGLGFHAPVEEPPITPAFCSSPVEPQSPALSQSQELRIIAESLVSLTTGSQVVASLHASFAALPFAVDAHLTLCDRIGEALHAVQVSLQRRPAISAELWHLRSESCQRKYDHRLMSLRKTLQRLHRLANAFPLRVTRFDRMFELLNQHHTKLADLADKFNATFDRLKVRHLHRILSDAYADAVKRIPFPHTTTDLFDARKEERKTARAAGRLGRYDYALHREGRRPSLVVAQ